MAAGQNGVHSSVLSNKFLPIKKVKNQKLSNSLTLLFVRTDRGRSASSSEMKELFLSKLVILPGQGQLGTERQF